jgi:Mce-associated membrane protein
MLASGTEVGVSVADKESKADNAQPERADPEAVDASEAVDADQKSDAAESAVSGPRADDASESTDAQEKPTRATVRRISISIRTLLVAALITALLATAGVLAWFYIGAETKLNDKAKQAANNSHAEQIALDYAVDAAKIDVQDLNVWKKNLVKGTTAELKEKLSSAATSMEQILVPLQWKSTAVPLVAKVRSSANGIYVVVTFVGVETKTVQAPDGLQSTATYSITIDSQHDWQISDVGGIGAVVGQK